MGREASFEKRVECLTTSNAYEKSSAITWTYGSLSSIEVEACKRDITAAVMKPVVRKACWSARPVESGALLRK